MNIEVLPDSPVSLAGLISVDNVDEDDNFDGFSEIIEMEENLSPANSAFNALLRKQEAIKKDL